VFSLRLVFFGLCFSCGFCWPSQHQSANCHSCDRNVWHWPTLAIVADEVSGDIIVVGQYQCWTGTRLETLVYRLVLVLVLVSENRPDLYDLN
jgi:hypothetical protein